MTYQVDLDRIFDYLPTQETFKNGLRDEALIEVLYGTSIRVGELVSMKISNVDYVNHRLKVMGKGSKERYVPLGRKAEFALKKYCFEERNEKIPAFSDYVFLNSYGRRLSSQSAEFIVADTCEKAGVSKRVYLHMFRHTMATNLLDNGADLISIKQIWGHSSVSTTMIYTHVSSKSLLDSYHKFFTR
ncbi:hypothetical protein EQG49_13245 [Periweissella cryptocerci]|uniref:Tyr recombinase domain-containing protein n=1 Tax=Periweissella cryptocerci TaxID=2506420 RepID=A0A4P6YWW4_9LACO|nr:tyrosine-type recombinase/integrase [Periweissella cryptocerci]QBO37362.1 hypothetical protein EQG49_13245 [Periweissella cryptocerci]